MNKKKSKNPFSSKKLIGTLGVTRKLFGLLWQWEPSIVIQSFITYSIPAILPFINAYIYKLIIDLVIASVGSGSVDYKQLAIYLIFRFISLLALDVSYTFQDIIDKKLWIRFPAKFYTMILSKISSLELEYFEDPEFRNKLQNLRESYITRPINTISFVFYLWQSFLQFCIAIAALSLLNWWILFPILLTAVPIFLTRKSHSEFAWGIWNGNSPYRKKFWYLSELIQGGEGIKEIKIFQLSKKFIGELHSMYERFLKENEVVLKKYLISNNLLNVFSNIVYGGIEIFIIYLAILKTITIGSISYYTSVMNNLQNGVSGMLRNAARLYENAMYIVDMFEVLESPSKIIVPESPTKIDYLSAPKIEFKNVTFSYPKASKASLEDFSMVIEPGEKIAIVGENGAGKTTLIKLLARLYDVSSGEILINGVNVRELDLDRWHAALGILLQDFIKYEYSIKDNIYFGNTEFKEDIEKIKEAAKNSGADSVASNYKDGYDQMLGKTFENSVELSAGQWQKVALGRAFFRNSPILILDEPTASVDAKAEAEIFEHVERLAKNKTVIIISHRFSTVKNADKIFVINEGKIIEAGAHKELIKKKGTYATLFNLQAKAYK
ncbi:MAG: ABC transporter ATP-binding protein [bacterium]